MVIGLFNSERVGLVYFDGFFGLAAAMLSETI